eukprot:436800-Pleurochrysis_carterae.AAC.1
MAKRTYVPNYCTRHVATHSRLASARDGVGRRHRAWRRPRCSTHPPFPIAIPAQRQQDGRAEGPKGTPGLVRLAWRQRVQPRVHPHDRPLCHRVRCAHSVA